MQFRSNDTPITGVFFIVSRKEALFAMRKRNIRVRFWMNEKEYAKLCNLVKRSGLSTEAYLRHLIAGIIPNDAPPPDYYAMMRELYYIGNNLNQIAHIANASGFIDVKAYEENTKMLTNAIEQITKAVVSPRKL